MFSRARRWFTRPARKPARPAPAARWRPTFEALEDRTTPTASAITSNFNGTAIAGGNYLWFNSVAKVSGVPAQGATLHVTHQTVTFNGTQVAVPDTTLTLSPNTTAAGATTGVDAGGDWVTTGPRTFSGNVFLSGESYHVPAGGIAGGSVKQITWSGDFTSDTAGLTVKWQWSAAVYKAAGFSDDNAALGVKPTDTATAQYANSDHAGTPEVFKKSVVGGARGGGGSNYTGSYSATGAVGPNVVTAPQGVAVLSGHVLASYFSGDLVGMDHVRVVLTDAGGNQVGPEVFTDATGYFEFTDVPVGTFTITTYPPDVSTGLPRTGGQSVPGYVNGMEGWWSGPTTTTMAGIPLAGGDEGTDFDFYNFYGNGG